jgi:hypothetical protein
MIKAYVLAEYVDKGRDVRGQKNYKGYMFSPETDWKCVVPGNIAEELLPMPNVFKLYFEEDLTGGKINEVLEKVDKLSGEVKAMKARMGKTDKS